MNRIVNGHADAALFNQRGMSTSIFLTKQKMMGLYTKLA